MMTYISQTVPLNQGLRGILRPTEPRTSLGVRTFDKELGGAERGGRPAEVDLQGGRLNPRVLPL